MFNIFVRYGDAPESIILDYDKRGHPRACLWTTRGAAQTYINECAQTAWFQRGLAAPTFIIKEANQK